MKTIEIISGGKKAQFTTKSVTLDGKEFFYSRMTSVACDTESHCYRFTYDGETVLLPYEDKDSRILNAIFKQVQTIEEKRRFTQALAAADAERLRAAAAAQETQKTAPVQKPEAVETPAEKTPAEPEIHAETSKVSKKFSIAEIMEEPAVSETAEPAADVQETAAEKPEVPETETPAEEAAEEKKAETKAEKKARKQAERQAKKEAKAKAKAEAKAAKEAAKAAAAAPAAETAETKEEAPADAVQTTAEVKEEAPADEVQAPAEAKEEAPADAETSEAETAEQAETKAEDKPKKEKTPMDPEKKARLKKSLTRFGIVIAIIVILSVVYFFVFGTNNQPTQVAPNSNESQQYDDIDQLIDDLQ